MLIPNFKSPEACSEQMSMANLSIAREESDTCWHSTYKDFPFVYHRLDVLSQSPSFPARFRGPFGGVSACSSEYCSYDTSTWLAAPSSFISVRQYLELPHTFDTIESISQASGAGVATKNVLGGGLRKRALSSLKITSVMEAFWKDLLGVEGAEVNGSPASLNEAKSDARRDVLQLLFATESGILRMYPGARASVPADYNARREPYYTRAINHQGELVVSQPSLLQTLNTTYWTVTISKVRIFCRWLSVMLAYWGVSTPASVARESAQLCSCHSVQLSELSQSFCNLCPYFLTSSTRRQAFLRADVDVRVHRQSIFRHRRKRLSRSISMCSALLRYTID